VRAGDMLRHVRAAGTEVVQQWRIQSPLCSLTPDATGTTDCRLRIRRCGGLDVHKDTIAACVRWTEDTGESRKGTRVFGTLAFSHPKV